MKKTIIYAVVLVVVSLAVGVVVGSLVERRNGHARRKHFMEGMREKMQDRREKRPEKVEGVLLNRLTQQLSLTQDQQVKVKMILDDARKGVESFKEGAYKKMGDIREETNTKIQGLLTADQKEKFTKIISDLKERQSKGKRSGPGCPRPPEGPDIE